jgi:CRP/FNR family transcriptional regulator, nitrogen oxide reductase regulator
MIGPQPENQATVVRDGRFRLAHGNAIGRRADLIKGFPLFSDLALADCRDIVAKADELEFKRRQTIYLEGAPVRQVILLTSGCVKIIQVGTSGAEVILRLAGPRDVVGAVGGGTRLSYCSTARALRSSTALVWDASVFESILHKYPILRRNTARILGQRLEEIEERFREVSTKKVAPRLSSEIARLLNQVGQSVNGAVELSLSREELAQLTGTTLFTVSRLLSSWQQRGIVRTGREVLMVCKLQALVELAESD